MSKSKFDVIVIGSGPAGATAAYRLAREGLETLVLEKEKLPRYKACGGALTNKVFRTVDFDVGGLVEDSVTRVVLAHRNRALARLDTSQARVSLVMRDKFDFHLTQSAARQGAIVHDGESVRDIAFEESRVLVRTDAGEYTSDLVVGADGANGVTARAAGLDRSRSTAAAFEMELAVSDAQLKVWRHQVLLDLGAIPHGYAWIFPKADHLSVGIGTYIQGPLYRHFAQRTGRPRLNLRAELNGWMKRESTLLNHRVLVERGHLVPLGDSARPLHKSRVVLTGDAGGLIEPLFAEGIYYALRSGQIAAEVIVDAFRREDLELSAYTERIWQEFLPDFERGAACARLLYRLPGTIMVAMSVVSPLRNSISGIMESQANLSSPFWRWVQRVGNWLDA